MNITRRAFTNGLLTSSILAGTAGCVGTNLATGRTSFTGLYDIQDDIKMGQQEAPKLTQAFGGVYDDPGLRSYIDGIGEKLAQYTEYQQFPYSFTILNSPIVNAFALPGGYVYVSRGLLALASNEAETAGVIAHELGHVNARHTAERLSSSMIAQGLLLGLGVATGSREVMELAQFGVGAYIQSFSRSQEFEADSLAVRYMSKAGYDPNAMAEFLKTLREHSMLEARMMGLPAGRVDEWNIMSTHPRTLDRVKAAIEQSETQIPQTPILARETYMRQIDGILYGDDPNQGIIKGRQFIHPTLRFSYEVPEGFILRNSPERVIAQSNDGRSAIIMSGGQMKQTNNVYDYLRRERGANNQLNALQRFEVNGVSAATGVTRINTKAGPMDARLVVFQADNNSVYHFDFLSAVNQTQALESGFRNTIYSFKRLSQAEAQSIRPLRLRTVPAKSQDRIENLATALPYGQYNNAAFRVLNDLENGKAIRNGDILKIISN